MWLQVWPSKQCWKALHFRTSGVKSQSSESKRKHAECHGIAIREDMTVDARLHSIKTLIAKWYPSASAAASNIDARSLEKEMVDVSEVIKLVCTNTPFDILSTTSYIQNLLIRGQPALSKPDAYNLFYEVDEYCRRAFAASLGSERAVNFTMDGWDWNGRSVIGITTHWVSEDFLLKRSFLDLIDEEDFPKTSGVQAALVRLNNDVMLPEHVYEFVTTTDNAAAARGLGDLRSGGDGFGCSCHLLNLCVKTDLLEHRTMLEFKTNVTNKIAAIATFLTTRRLTSALESAQRDLGATRIRALQVPQATRWHSSLKSYESYIALEPAIKRMIEKRVIVGDDMLLSRAQRLQSQYLIEVLEPVRIASRTHRLHLRPISW